uniref:Uncharacterized protein n=1 Tax=Pipistrellus kuhlii TaxID=59472 RepID=A0A7J7V0G2_PIPKU|nr:hypothetical protein mPipKuh1_008627 [Pipistrellus kuhlii]
MEAGGDTAAPAPGDAEDLEDTRLLGEEAGDGGGVQEDPTESEDRSLEERGAPFQDPRPRTSQPACCHHCPNQSPLPLPVGSGILQPLRTMSQVTLRVTLGAKAETQVTRTGAASGSTCLY